MTDGVFFLFEALRRWPSDDIQVCQPDGRHLGCKVAYKAKGLDSWVLKLSKPHACFILVKQFGTISASTFS